MENNSQNTPGQANFSFRKGPGGRWTRKVRRGALVFSIRFLIVILVLSLLPVNARAVFQPGSAAAQAEGPVYLPFVSSNNRPVPSGSGDWPMAGANPQRTSWTSAEVKGNLKAEWFTHFDAYISQKVQVIAANNKLFIAASDGLHALSSNNGQRLWHFPTSLPLGNAPTYHNGVVYVGGFDRRMYAINADNGAEIWRFEAGAGFQTNPLVIDGRVYAGNRDGYFYALDAASGRQVWRFKTGGPILFSAAYQDGVLYFASNNMYAYALNANNGALVWKSGKLPGVGFHSWWPVIYNDYVVFPGSWPYRIPGPFGNATHNLLDQAAYPPNAADGTTIGPYGSEPGDWAPGTRTMNASRISQYFESYPQRRTMIVLRRADGREYTYDSDGDGRPEYAPFLHLGETSGTRIPPAVGPDSVLYQGNDYIFSGAIPRGHITGWKFGTSTISIPTNETNAVDEPMGFAIGGNTVYWKRCCDRKAGSFDLASGSSYVYYDEGGKRLRRTLPELFQKGWDFSYWKHGDTTPPIPYNGRVYLIANNAVVAFSPNGKDPVMPSDEPRGANTGVRPDTIERSNVYTGLNTKLTVSSNTWPLLYQQERYFEIREEPSTRANHFTLFEVAGTTSGSPTSLQASESGITASITSSYSGQTLNAWVSKRAPALLFQNTSNTYHLRGRFAGFAYVSPGGVQVRTGSATINGSEMNEGWLLAWDSTGDHRWAPVVISLQRIPSQVRLDSSGLVLTFPGASGYLAVTPLYGMSAPRTNEVNTWPSGIPQVTVDRARLINRAAHAFPMSSTDSLTINSQSGDAEWTYTYQFTTITDDWNTSPLQIAYLPPHTALAAWNGSPIQINGGSYQQTVTDMNFVTPVGRAGGPANTNVARVRLPGIANYWRQVPSAPAEPSGDPLQAKLVEEVEKILAAGHLLPAYGKTGIWDSRGTSRIGPYLADYWHNPAETIYTLIRALPLLPSNLRNQVRQYIAQEYAAYPTHSVSHVGWASGASREAFAFPPEFEAERKSEGPCGECNSWGFPPENAYASWMYVANNFSSAGSIFTATAARFNPYPQFKQSLPYSLNSYIAGTIGYLRLASLANAGPQPEAERTLVNLLTLRAALSKYPSALQAVGFEYGGYKWTVRTFAPNMPDTLFILRNLGTNWSQSPLYGFQIDLIYGLSGPGTGGAYGFGTDYVNMAPEQARFMRDYVRAEEQAAVAEYERRTPYWFVAKAEEAAGEGITQPIYDTIALFNAKAMILGASRGELTQYLDVPGVPVGDLYYIQKLILALEARP